MDFKVAAVLPAGGVGERMGLPTPKQYCKLLNRPLISYTIEAFERMSWLEYVVVTISPDRLDFMHQILEEYGHHKTLVSFGDTARHRSIYKGIKHLSESNKEPDVVIIHDAVRPFVEETILKEVASAAQEHGAAGAIRPLVSTVIGTDMDGFLDHSLERIKYKASEMPQAFQYSLIKAAYQKCTDYDLDYGTECLHLAQKYMNTKVRLIEGPVNLWKVTHKKDLYAAEATLKEQLNREVVAFGNCSTDNKEKLQKAFSQFETQVHFHDTFQEWQELHPKANNFIFFTTICDAKMLKSSMCQVEESFVLSTQTDEKSGCVKSSCKTDWRAGTILYIIGHGTDEKLNQIRETLQEKAKELKKSGVCLNAIILKDKENEDWCEMSCNIVYHRNLIFSGQTFFVQ